MNGGFYFIRNSSDPTMFNYVVFAEGRQEEIVQHMKNANTPQYKMKPFRCDKCGYIEHYAVNPEQWR